MMIQDIRIKGAPDLRSPGTGDAAAAAAQGSNELANPGTLVIEDRFVEQKTNHLNDLPPHGVWVEAAARQQGFTGPIVERSVDGEYDFPKMDADQQTMDRPGVDSKTFLAAVEDSILAKNVYFLQHSAAEFDSLRAGGLHDGAVNFSYGLDRASSFKELSDFSGLQESVDFAAVSDGDVSTRLDNYARALGLDRGVLVQSNPAGEAERKQLNLDLLQIVDRAYGDNPELQQAKARYDEAVSGLAAKDVSVVVAGGNEASDLPKDLRDSPLVGANFYKNLLSNERTVVVGSVGMAGDQSGAQERISDFNSPVHDDLLADGVLSLPGQTRVEAGTSLAAPRVAATVAKIHGDHPGTSVQDSLLTLKTSLTHPLDGDSTWLVLDRPKT